MQRSNWSYMQASEELDRIIKSSDPSYVASTPCTTHSFSNVITPEVSCSICGHASAHFPIRSSSEVLKGSTMSTPLSKTQTHQTPSRSKLSFNDSRSYTHGHTSSSTKLSTSQLTHSANASRQLRHRLTPHPVAYSTSPLHHSSAQSHHTHSSTATPQSIIHMEAQSAANNVVAAFRELQAKTKMIEGEVSSAVVVRDELRQEVAEMRRKHGLARSKDEARCNRHMQSINASTDEQLSGLNYTRNVFQHQSDVEQTLTSQVKELADKQARLAEDIERTNAKIVAGEQRLRTLRENLITSRDQSNSMEKVLGSQSIREKSNINKEIDTLKAAIKEENAGESRSSIRIESLSKYMEIILKVNGDLVKALANRQSLDDKIANIAHKQMKKLLKNREKEVNEILTNARDIGVRKALFLSRNVHLLSDLYLKQSSRRQDSSLIETAARMAATSAANAVVATNLTSTCSSSCSACYRPKFIPSSSRSNQEFNVVASVSKAAREAKSLNARLASKVKSLDCEGIGALYKDVYRVDLQDMHDQLRAVKKVLQAQTP
mmetsp:Transcript_9088/g.17044  ORF Transcript_9088/g.17044 Transcript_9088/m.17044 type:complete len:548 (+) Transcript_9088:154-1797(+)